MTTSLFNTKQNLQFNTANALKVIFACSEKSLVKFVLVCCYLAELTAVYAWLAGTVRTAAHPWTPPATAVERTGTAATAPAKAVS